jgi:tetraprenyl-beta-curcumene synthase
MPAAPPPAANPVSTATHTDHGRVARLGPGELSPARVPPRSDAADWLGPAHAFTATVLRYLLRVLPQVSSELAHWRARAAEIPNPQLRRLAVQALRKRGNIEGAALFATLAQPAHRRRTVRALVAFQTAYNYLDALSELPSEEPIANGDQLHQALLTALHPDAPHLDYYAHNPDREDGGYLEAISDVCRETLAGLPSYAALAPTARAAAARIVDFQALNLSERQGGHDGLTRWATEATPPDSGLEWWETAAASGSSLAVHALIALAASPSVSPREILAIDHAYFPWSGALHSLLDSLVDRREDHQQGQRSLLDYYGSPSHAETRLAALVVRARAATQELPNPLAHRVILIAMCSYYLSAPQCATAEARTISDSLSEILGVPLNIAILMFRCRRRLHTLTDRTYT